MFWGAWLMCLWTHLGHFMNGIYCYTIKSTIFWQKNSINHWPIQHLAMTNTVLIHRSLDAKIPYVLVGDTVYLLPKDGRNIDNHGSLVTQEILHK